MDVIARVRERGSEFLFFSLTPPRLATERDRVREIAEVTTSRLRPLGLDGVILYDIDDEADRNGSRRPFPFMPTIDPADYLADHLQGWETPVVVYRAVGKYQPSDLRDWLAAQDPQRVMTVLVGAPSTGANPATSLRRAQALAADANRALLVGGVAIPERHGARGDEHLRLLAKQEAGCSFFVTQVVYDVNAAKNLVSDYHYECAARNTEPVPLVFTFSVCGSMKTLEFLRWLGVSVPKWIANDLEHATDTLAASSRQAGAIAAEIVDFCRALRMPFGLNVESVSIRQVEIEASVRLAAQLRQQLQD